MVLAGWRDSCCQLLLTSVAPLTRLEPDTPLMLGPLACLCAAGALGSRRKAPDKTLPRWLAES